MAKELSDSTPDERHLHLRRSRRAVEDVKKQMMWVLESLRHVTPLLSHHRPDS